MWLTFGLTSFCSKNLISFSFLLSNQSIQEFLFIGVAVGTSSFSMHSLVRLLLNMQWCHFNIYLLCSLFNHQLYFYIHIYSIRQYFEWFFFMILYSVRFVGLCVLVLKYFCCWWIAPIHLFRFARMTWQFTLSINKIFISIQIPLQRDKWEKTEKCARLRLGTCLAICYVLYSFSCIFTVVVCLSSQFGIFDLTRFPLPLPLLLMSSSAPSSLLVLLLLLQWLLLLLFGTFWTI